MSKERFIVDDGTEFVSDDRVFRNGKTVHNTRLDFSYSVDEIVEVLNKQGQYQDGVNEFMQNKIWYAQGMYHRTGDEKYKILEDTLRELREELYEPKHNSLKYGEILNEWYLEGKKE